MKCKNESCEYHDDRMTDNCSKGEPPNVEGCANDKGVRSGVLLPCPCCGSKKAVRAEPFESEGSDTMSTYIMGRVICRNCGLLMQTCCGQAEAEQRWNRRAR